MSSQEDGDPSRCSLGRGTVTYRPRIGPRPVLRKMFQPPSLLYGQLDEPSLTTISLDSNRTSPETLGRGIAELNHMSCFMAVIRDM
jgi:hypothetical protein